MTGWFFGWGSRPAGESSTKWGGDSRRWSFKWAEIEESCRDEPGCEWTCPQATSCFCKCRDLDEDEVAAAAEAVAAVTAKPASFRFLNW